MFLRLLVKRLLASGATEVERPGVKLRLVLCPFDVDGHAANWILGFGRSGCQVQHVGLARLTSALNDFGKNADPTLFLGSGLYIQAGGSARPGETPLVHASFGERLDDLARLGFNG